MTIRNSDGTTYRLRGPNRLMTTQDRWGAEDVILHNMSWDPVDPDLVRAVGPATRPEPAPKPGGTFLVHCLPARLVRHRDDLYGYERDTIAYGDRVSFEAGTTDSTDLEMVLWTADPVEVGVGSVVFPRDGARRWWKVESVVPNGAGRDLRCSPSDFQPSFD